MGQAAAARPVLLACPARDAEACWRANGVAGVASLLNLIGELCGNAAQRDPDLIHIYAGAARFGGRVFDERGGILMRRGDIRTTFYGDTYYS